MKLKDLKVGDVLLMTETGESAAMSKDAGESDIVIKDVLNSCAMGVEAGGRFYIIAEADLPLYTLKPRPEPIRITHENFSEWYNKEVWVSDHKTKYTPRTLKGINEDGDIIDGASVHWLHAYTTNPNEGE